MRAPTLLFRVGAAQKPAGIPVLAGFLFICPVCVHGGFLAICCGVLVHTREPKQPR